MEAFSRIFCGHAALDSTSVREDVMLRETQFRESLTLSYTDLRVHQINTETIGEDVTIKDDINGVNCVDFEVMS